MLATPPTASPPYTPHRFYPAATPLSARSTPRAPQEISPPAWARPGRSTPLAPPIPQARTVTNTPSTNDPPLENHKSSSPHGGGETLPCHISAGERIQGGNPCNHPSSYK